MIDTSEKDRLDLYRRQEAEVARDGYFPLIPCVLRKTGRYAGQRLHVFIDNRCFLCSQELPC